jgi:hypothetical protein
VLEHLDDLDADFRALYRVDGVGDEDFGELSGPRFLALAERTFCYEGTMAALAAGQSETSRPESREVVPATKAELMADPAFAGLFDF